MNWQRYRRLRLIVSGAGIVVALIVIARMDREPAPPQPTGTCQVVLEEGGC